MRAEEYQAHEESHARIMMAIGTDVQSKFVTVRRIDPERFSAMLDDLCDEIEGCDDN